MLDELPELDAMSGLRFSGLGFEGWGLGLRANSLGSGSASVGCTLKLPWREAGPPNHHDDKMDSDE